jgi:multimeric flavodoxin WrbA
MKVLGIVGSPRKEGNTDLLVSEALKGAASAGAEVERVFLPSLTINPCKACDACEKTGRCVQKDDAIALTEKMLDADAVILGTPIYWWGPSAQMKAFIDRWYAPNQVAARQVRMRKPYALVAAFGDSDPATARHLVGMLQSAFDYLKATFPAQLLVSAGDRGAVADNEKAMKDAFELGVKMAGK